jgi:hypothetical protein
LADFVVKVVDVLGDGDCGIVQPSYVVRHRADAFQIPEDISPASALLAAETVKPIDLAPEVARRMTSLLHPVSTLVVTDAPAGDETRTASGFAILTHADT